MLRHPVKITKMPNLFDINQLDVSLKANLKQIDANKYQAINSATFFLYRDQKTLVKWVITRFTGLSQIFSYHLNLPIMGSYLTRTLNLGE